MQADLTLFLKNSSVRKIKSYYSVPDKLIERIIKDKITKHIEESVNMSHQKY